MKRYIVFAGYNYYPRGGWRDFKDSFKTEAEAIETAKAYVLCSIPGNNRVDWSHIVDLKLQTIIHEFDRGN